MGECLTYLKESLFSSTLAPSLCTEENNLLNESHSKPANVGPLEPPTNSTSFSRLQSLGVLLRRQHCSGEDLCQRPRPAPRPHCAPYTPKASALLLLGLWICIWKVKKAEEMISETQCYPYMHSYLCDITDLFKNLINYINIYWAPTVCQNRAQCPDIPVH